MCLKFCEIPCLHSIFCVYHNNSYRVVSEIDEVLEGKESVSSGDLDKLAYTTAVSMASLLRQKLQHLICVPPGIRRDFETLSSCTYSQIFRY